MQAISKLIVSFVFAVTTLGLGGCVAPPSKTAMAVNSAALQNKVPANLSNKFHVDSVTGGKETSLITGADIDNKGFQEALDLSLLSTGYKAVDAASAPYRLKVNIQKMDSPLFGIDMRVISTITYSIVGQGTTNSTTVTATGLATPSDALLAAERMTIAVERSARQNILSFLEQLPQLVRP